ncbi:MAG: host attachment protein [Acetobacteraceae bacterium]|nr:host attachment protein [Acetobacteraceae bacterium]
MLRPKVWAAVADGKRLRVLARRVLAQDPEEAVWHELQSEALEMADPPSRVLGTDRPGRVRESQGGARHAYEPRYDLHEGRKADFAEIVAERLERAAKTGQFDRLVLIAPPATLGHLRAAIGEQARGRLRGTLARDLTRARSEAISKQLAAQKLPHG